MGLPPELRSLLSAEAYDHPVVGLQLIETHISWVLLTGEFAYKIKRPVMYPFVDLRSMERRAFLCAEEVRLNRRFSPELYLDVVPITSTDGRAQMGGQGRVVEHAVRMRQFAPDEQLDRLLATQAIGPEALSDFGASLARIHDSLPVADNTQQFGHATQVRASILENVRECIEVSAAVGLAENIRPLAPLLESQVESAASLIASRREAGRVRECHGDLHARNVVRHAGRLVAFDCLEFEPSFRWIDVAEEVAFLVMDLQTRDARPHATAFLNGYLAESGDYQACRLIRLFGADRALVRAKVAALEVASAEPKRREAARGEHLVYVRSAGRFLEHPKPRLILMSGVSGSGKTWLAQRLAIAANAVHARSDVERKRLAGIPERTTSGSTLQGGLYTEDMNANVYARLAECARDILAGGSDVIVDATFRRRADRAAFSALAGRRDVPVALIRCHAPIEVLRSRIAERGRHRNDASEADLSVLEWQLANQEPVDAAEDIAVIDIDTTQADVVSRTRAHLEATFLY